MSNINIVAILSTTVLPLDGTYKVVTLKNEERNEIISNLTGKLHYIGHPDTKTLVEALGCVKASTNLFSGLFVNESALCFPIKQGQSTRATEGFTYHQAINDLESLDIRLITRIE